MSVSSTVQLAVLLRRLHTTGLYFFGRCAALPCEHPTSCVHRVLSLTLLVQRVLSSIKVPRCRHVWRLATVGERLIAENAARVWRAALGAISLPCQGRCPAGCVFESGVRVCVVLPQFVVAGVLSYCWLSRFFWISVCTLRHLSSTAVSCRVRAAADTPSAAAATHVKPDVELLHSLLEVEESAAQ